MVVRVEYDRSNRVGYAYEGQLMGLPMQSPRGGGNFSIGRQAPGPPPALLAPALLSGIQRAAQTVLGVYLKHNCSRVTSASSALGVLNDFALYKSTHSLPVFLLTFIGQGRYSLRS